MCDPYATLTHGVRRGSSAMDEKVLCCSACCIGRERIAYQLPLCHRDGHHTEDAVERTENSGREQ